MSDCGLMLCLLLLLLECGPVGRPRGLHEPLHCHLQDVLCGPRGGLRGHLLKLLVHPLLHALVVWSKRKRLYAAVKIRIHLPRNNFCLLLLLSHRRGSVWQLLLLLLLWYPWLGWRLLLLLWFLPMPLLEGHLHLLLRGNLLLPCPRWHGMQLVVMLLSFVVPTLGSTAASHRARRRWEGSHLCRGIVSMDVSQLC